MTEEDTFKKLQRKVDIMEMLNLWSNTEIKWGTKDARAFFRSYGWDIKDYEYELSRYVELEDD